MEKHAFTLYDASAGSGKTYTLVKEYLKIILTSKKNDAYHNILAITFTNKAVHEMKSRIVTSLTDFTKDNPSQKTIDLMLDISKETSLSQAQIKTKSQQIIKHIIHNYAAFDISTIDKFTHKVIRTFAFDLGLPMTFEVSLDTESLLTEAIDSIISEAGEDKTLTQLLVDYTMEKTDDDKSWDISREIFQAGKMLLNENNREEIEHLKDKPIEAFIEIKHEIKEKIKNLLSETVQLAQSALSLIDEKNIDRKSFSRGTFINHINSIVAQNFNPNNKTFHEFDDIQILKSANDREQIEAIIPDLLETLKKIYPIFEKINLNNAILKNITPITLLNTISQKLKTIQTEQNILSISEFNQLIFDEIQNQPAPFIYERLGERYQHFFIDEFQDTSEMQWHNLIPLIDNQLASETNGEAGSLLLVGDPKQSIYRWRGGKAEQFIGLSKEENPQNKTENPFSNKDKKVESLATNYRSFSKVIDFNNHFFAAISEQFENEDYKKLYKDHSFQEFNSKKGGYVQINFLPIIEKGELDEDEEELTKENLYLTETLKTINEVLENGFDYKDIAILTRKRAQGIAIASFLTENKIPLLSSETLMIQNSTEVQFIIHALNYVRSKIDKEAKAKMLYYLAQNNYEIAKTHDFIATGIAFETETELEKWLLEINVNLNFDVLRKKSLYETVEILIATFLNSKRNDAYILYFLDLVLEKEVRLQMGISDFLDFWELNSQKFSIPSPEGKNAVKILTIHKSKGLEFPVVILPFADENYSRTPKEKIWLNGENTDIDLPRVLVDNSKIVEDFGDEPKAVFQTKKQEELLDNVNVLYVALTRAEEQLYVISQMQKPNKDGDLPYSMATFFMNYLHLEEEKLVYDFGNKTRVSEKTILVENGKNIESVAEYLDPKNIKIAKKEAVMWGTKQQEAIEYGNLIHEVIASVKTEKDIDTAIQISLEQGLFPKTDEIHIRKTIEKIVLYPDLKDFFAENCRVLNERSIIEQGEKTVKPDRMVITTNNEVLLLDYKTGAQENKHKKQLHDYQIAIEKMGYKVTKKSLVYIGETVEIVNL